MARPYLRQVASEEAEPIEKRLYKGMKEEKILCTGFGFQNFFVVARGKVTLNMSLVWAASRHN